MKDLSKEEMVEVLMKVEDGVLAFSDGATPYCVPFGFVYTNDSVFLTLFPKGRKWEYFQKNQKVCFNVYCWNDDHTEWASVVVDGIMEQIDDLATIKSVVKANIEKMGLDPENYLAKRMEYYEKSMDNQNALKVFKINTSTMGGKKMQTMLGG